jgi:hypothetical protein
MNIHLRQALMFKYVLKKAFVQIHVLVHENTFWFETSAVRPNKPAPYTFGGI